MIQETSETRKNFKFRSGVSFFSNIPKTFSWKLLVFFLLIIYVPFMNSRVVRPAGDDKVYVSQAIEMAEAGNWFLQRLGNEGNYYKGPLHYILLRVGMALFGFKMWVTIYMNLILVILGALAIGSIVHRNMREYEGWAFWAGFAFAVNAGIFSHVFASQMEVETAAFFAIGLYFLDRSGRGWKDLKFWLVAGLTGWLKSPLHSVLLGSAAILFWGYTKELWPRILSLEAWLCALAGILVCTVGYAPAFLLDRDVFIYAYVNRETLWKPSNGTPWHYPITPFFTYSLLPWMLPGFVAYFDFLTRFFRKQRAVKATVGSRRVVALGAALIIPNVAFFLYHPYRGQNYNLPAMGGLILLVAGTWATRAKSWDKAYSLSLALTALAILSVPLSINYVTSHFNPMPFWWPSWQMAVIWIGALLTARGFWKEGVSFQMIRPDSLARRSLWLFLALGTLMATFGEREMIDVRDRIYTAKKNNETLNLTYYNLQKNIWSEWGYLNFMIPYKVRGLFTEEDLAASIKNGDTILVPGDEWIADMKPRVEKLFPKATWKMEPWRRWKTKGKNEQGVPAWKEAWDLKDLSKVERNFYMVHITPN